MLKTLQICKSETAAVTFEQIVPLLIGLLIGLLVSLIVGSWWSDRAQTINLAWLNAHDRVMVWLLILGMFALGVFVAYVVLR
jgi:hypothetical protein